jgi:hypothetical protein
MNRTHRRLFIAGCWAALITAVVHLIGHLSGPQPPQNDTERELMRLITTVRFALPGGERTLWDFMQGFSLSFALLLAMIGGTGLAIVRRAAADVQLMWTLTAFYAAGLVTLLTISLIYFFLVTTAFIAVVTACFVAALLVAGRESA